MSTAGHGVSSASVSVLNSGIGSAMARELWESLDPLILGQLNHHANLSSLILQLVCARMRRIAKPQSQDEPSIAVFSASDHAAECLRLSTVLGLGLNHLYLDGDQ
ncbi:hypothetical protein BHE90_003182 [Fusarium euwallaceae]|uniref:Uncharacterized protein n=1 Tax=Fusarium euwallaceae TaxID=1147111 RepID=A0A430M2T4_9HYPO|nr:hypothetical protein BHE90_003182 [Fusarium euwallaceae]